MEPEKPVGPEKPAEPERAAEPAEAAKPVKHAGPERPMQPEGAPEPAKRKRGKILVFLLIAMFVVVTGALAAVFLFPHGEQDEQRPAGTAESDSSSQTQNAAALLPESSDSAPALAPDAAQASSAPEPAIPPASETQPDSQTPALDTPDEPDLMPEQPALPEPAPDEPALQPDDSEYVFPQSSSAYLTDADLAGLDKATLRLARNEICARHGKMFRDAELRAYFESKSWYSGTVEADVFDRLVNIYNEYEVANIALIQKYEAM